MSRRTGVDWHDAVDCLELIDDVIAHCAQEPRLTRCAIAGGFFIHADGAL